MYCHPSLRSGSLSMGRSFATLRACPERSEGMIGPVLIVKTHNVAVTIKIGRQYRLVRGNKNAFKPGERKTKAGRTRAGSMVESSQRPFVKNHGAAWL